MQTALRVKKNYMKCDRCRDDHKPCIFTEFISGFPRKCQRCKELGHQCSSPGRKRRRTRDCPLEGRSDFAISPKLRSLSNGLEDVHVDQYQPLCDPQPRILAGPHVEEDRIFADFATILTTQNLLLECEMYIHLCRDKLPEVDITDQLAQTIDAVFRRLCDDVDYYLEECTKHARSLSVQDHERFGWKIQAFRYRFELGQSQRFVLLAHKYSEVMGGACGVSRPHADTTFPSSFKSLLCTENIISRQHSIYVKRNQRYNGSPQRLIEPCSEDYQGTQAQVLELLKSVMGRTVYIPSQGKIRLDVLTHAKQILTGFPAMHIAYLNGDKEIALELWEERPLHTDVLGRTLAHLAVLAGDVNLLRCMENHDSVYQVLGSTTCDVFGLSAAATAVMLDDCICFKLLFLYQLKETGCEELLLLASSSNSTSIVEDIINGFLVLAPYNRAIDMALERGHENVLRLFFPSGVVDGTCYKKAQLMSWARKASERGLVMLAGGLKDVIPVEQDKTDTLTSLESYNLTMIRGCVETRGHVNGIMWEGKFDMSSMQDQGLLHCDEDFTQASSAPHDMDYPETHQTSHGDQTSSESTIAGNDGFISRVWT